MMVSHGAYDLTIEPLSSLWNFTSDEHVIPAEDDITAAAERVNWKNVKLDGNTLTFLSPDTTIDLGSIAKGYIADRMKDYLTESGVESASSTWAATYSVSVNAQTTSRSASGCRNRLPTMQRSLPI